MRHINGSYRREVEGETIVFVSEDQLSSQDYTALIAGESFTFSARNEFGYTRDNNFEYHGRKIGRTICKPTQIIEKEKGYDIYLIIDIDYLPILRNRLNVG